MASPSAALLEAFPLQIPQPCFRTFVAIAIIPSPETLLMQHACERPSPPPWEQFYGVPYIMTRPAPLLPGVPFSCALPCSMEVSSAAARGANFLERPLHDDKADEADITDDTDAEVVAECLADLDSVAQPKIRNLAWLDCTQAKTFVRDWEAMQLIKLSNLVVVCMARAASL